MNSINILDLYSLNKFICYQYHDMYKTYNCFITKLTLSPPLSESSPNVFPLFSVSVTMLIYMTKAK